MRLLKSRVPKAAVVLSALTPSVALADNEVAGNLIMLKQNGAWSWFQDNRAIVDNNQLIFGTVAGVTNSAASAGDTQATSYNLTTGATTVRTLAPALQRDDHNAPVFLTLPDGRYLAVWERHGSDDLMHRAITTSPGSIANWGSTASFDINPSNANGNTYANVYRLSAEGGKIYNFSRSVGYDPNYSVSTDNGQTFTYGGRLMTWVNPDGSGAGRPYVRYASNNTDTIWFTTTEDHPRDYANSIYAGYVRGGNVYQSDGTLIGPLSTTSTTSIQPTSFTKIFQGNANNVGWTTDMELDSSGNPYTAFSVRKTGQNDIRYHYARFNGSTWVQHEIAYAGNYLYSAEGDYSGLVALDPGDPNTLYISTNAHPDTNAPLISSGDGLRHWEIFKGVTTDGGTNWTWTPITSNSTVDNIRPIIADSATGERPLIWLRGSYTTYSNYDLDVVGLLPPPTGWNYWKNATGGNWDTAANWNVAVPNAAGAAVYFGISSVPPTAHSTITISGTRTVGALTFAHSTYSYSLVPGAGGVLALNNGAGTAASVAVNAGSHAINTPVMLSSDGVNVATTGGSELTIGGNISGSGGINKSSGGSLVLSGSNTYSGATTVSGGVLRAAGAALSSNSNLSINGGLFGSSTTRTLGTGPGQIRLPGGSSGFTADGANTTVTLGGGSPIQWGSLAFNPSVFVLNSNGATHNVTVTNHINLGTTARTVSVGASTGTMSGILSGTGGLTKEGPGTLVFSGANTYSGATTVLAGTVNVSGSLTATSGIAFASGGSGVLRTAGALGTGTINISSNGAAFGPTSRFELTSGITLANPIALAPRNNSSVAIQSVGGNNTLSGPITIGTGGTQSRIQSDAGQLTLSGAISTTAGSVRNLYLQGAATGVVSGVITDNSTNPAGTINLHKEGVGTWTLGGANTYTGATTVSAGTLVLEQSFTTGLSVAVAGGATLRLVSHGDRMLKTQQLTVADGGRLDMRDNDVIVDYTGPSPEFTLRDKALRARDGGTDGIFFTRTGDDDAILAFGEASELGITEFGGITVDGTTVVGKYTYYGDANFDGAVTTDDYVAVDLGRGTGNSWVQGDFDLNGAVTTDDYVVVDLNLGKGTGDPLAWAEEQTAMIALHIEMFGQSYVEKLAYASRFGWVAASVPEPATPGLLIAAGIVRLGRRRRRRRRSN